jgi:hypothetical protein
VKLLLATYVLIVLGYALSVTAALLLVIAVGKGVRALVRRISAKRAAKGADTRELAETRELVIPVLLDLRRPPHGARGRHR